LALSFLLLAVEMCEGIERLQASAGKAKKADLLLPVAASVVDTILQVSFARSTSVADSSLLDPFSPV
jgi:hypothetical protein